MRTKLIVVLIGLVLSVKSRRDTASEEVDLDGQTSSQNGYGNAETVDNATGTIEAAEATGNQIPTDVVQTDSAAETPDTDQGKSDDDKVNEDDIHDSLADYIAGLFKASNNVSVEQGGVGGNATQPQTPGPAANGSDAGIPPVEQGGRGLTEQSAGPTSDQGGDTSAEQPEAQPSYTDMNEGEEDDDRDDHILDDDNNHHDMSSMDTSSPSGSTTSPYEEFIEVDCSVEVDLTNYCPDIPPAVRSYFDNDTTLRGLRSPVFDMGIVHELMSCPRGEWCLENKLDVFKGMQEKIVDGPLCDNGMWECIFKIMVLREDCQGDVEFMFVVDALTLVCGLSDPNPRPQDAQPYAEETTCFAYVLAALHLTYADFLANDMADFPPKEGAFCDGYGLKMSETYLCADDRCKGQFYSRQAMEKFGRWMWFMTDLDERQNTCKIPNNTCGPLEGALVKPTGWFGMTSSSPFWTSTAASPGIPVKGEVAGGAADLGALDKEDESLMIALFVATAVGLMFMVLGLVFWRRRSHRSAYYYRTVSDGYDKVPNDEAHLLGRSAD